LLKPFSVLRIPRRGLRPRFFGYEESPLLGTHVFQYAQVASDVVVEPNRHVLSQMVVAGVMFHQPPIQVRVLEQALSEQVSTESE
jgi:hypothetical protein